MAELMDTVRNLLHKIVVQLFNWNHYTITIEHFFNKSINYTEKLFVATSTLQNEKKEFLSKVAILDEDIRSALPANIYNIEIYFYKNLVPDYKQLQDEYEVFGKDRLLTANFYGCDENFLQEALVFDNMYKQGFKSFDRFQCIDWEYATVAVTELAKLHALSFSFNFDQPQLYEDHLNVFRCNPIKNNTKVKKMYWRNVITATMEVTRAENKEKVRKYLRKNLPRHIHTFFKPLRKPVLGHGNFRPCNMLHRKTKKDGLEIMILNYKFMQEMSPVVDLMHLLMTGTDSQFRQDYYEHLRNYYYKQLCTSMRRLQVDPETTYTREDFDFEWEQKFPYSLCVAAFYLPLITMEEDKIPKNKQELKNCHMRNKSELFATRINDIVDDFIRWGLL